MNDIQTRKQTLRQRIIAARREVSASDRLNWSNNIVRLICDHPAYHQAKTVLGYLNFGAEFEAELWVKQALVDNKRVLLPRVNTGSKYLDLYQIRDLENDVAPGAWGIREPLATRLDKFDAMEDLNFVLLPGVAFTRDGERLGYGGGFYDKLLARLPHQPNLVAGAFNMQLVGTLPQETTDYKVEWLVTEQETIDCAAPA